MALSKNFNFERLEFCKMNFLVVIPTMAMTYRHSNSKSNVF
jgi:hypothetical protein